jgi:hypothetical protein
METLVAGLDPLESLQDFFKARSFLLYLVITTLLLTVLIEILSLFYGVNEYFPYIFLVPLFLVIFAFPEKGMVFTFVTGWVYIILVCIFGSLSIRVIAVHMAWFFTYITLGVVLANYLEKARARSVEAQQLLSKAAREFDSHHAKIENLYVEIRDPLQAIMLDSDTIPDTPEKQRILEQVMVIDRLLDAMDKGSEESRKVREYLQQHYDSIPMNTGNAGEEKSGR